MKKMMIAALTALTVLASTANTYAAGLVIEADGTKRVVQEDRQATTAGVGQVEQAPENIIMPFSLTGNDGEIKRGYFYDQLSDLDKCVYDGIAAGLEDVLAGNTDCITIDIPNEYNLYYDSTNGVHIKNGDTITSWNAADILLLYLGFEDMEFFYLNNKRASYNVKINQLTGNILQVIFYMDGIVYADPYTEDTWKAEYDRVDAKADEILATVADNATRYQKLRLINSWLLDNNDYNPYVAVNDDATASPLAWILSSALLYGTEGDDTKYPVCEGYSEAFKLLCDRLDIPCIIVTSSGHMWNAVQMEDGNWYYVDVTFNDPVINFPPGYSEEQKKAYREQFKYNYFLLGSDNTEMSDSAHAVAYDDFEITLPCEMSTADYVYKNTGDINKDGYLTQEDALAILKHISGTDTMSEAELAMADINRDGEINLTDVTAVLKAAA